MSASVVSWPRREADGAEGQRAVDAHGDQDVRRLDGAGGAGRPAGAGHLGQIEVHQQRLRLGAGTEMESTCGARAVSAALITMSGTAAVSRAASESRSAAMLRDVRIEFLTRQRRRATERHRAGDVLGAGADAELLSAAVDDRLDDVTVAHDQRADPLGRADLVAADGEQGAADGVEVDRDLAERLHAVGM